jgi:hypothetical protein
MFGAQIGSHDNDHVTKIDSPSLAVRKSTVVQNLQKNSENFSVGLFDLVKQDDGVGTSSYGLRELASWGRC